MATMTIQTKRAIEALKRAGLKRSDFSVTSPVNKYGEYEDVKISFKLFSKHLVPYINSMALQGFKVVIVRSEKYPFGSVTVDSFNEWSEPQFAQAGVIVIIDPDKPFNGGRYTSHSSIPTKEILDHMERISK